MSEGKKFDNEKDPLALIPPEAEFRRSESMGLWC